MTARYALQHVICSHILAVGNRRAELLPWKNMLTIHGHAGWLVVTLPDEGFDAAALMLLDGERCAFCTVDGNTRQVLR